MYTSLLFLAAALPLVPAETVLGVYLFHRHGDRTSKSFSPTSLTDLGYQQIWQAGNYYRSRYIAADASSPIYGISSNIAKTSQLSVESPVDTVLQVSAAGFLQGLYPPVGPTLGSQTLANGTTVQAPLGGYQLIPINSVASAASGAQSENSAWLQGQSGCTNGVVSSNNYFYSATYNATLKATAAFYRSVLPVINNTFTAATDTYFNAYSIYDLIHVSLIHNATIQSSNLLTTDTVHQLQTLADQHEFNLAYNASEPVRAIAGRTLAAQIVQALNSTIVNKSKQPLNIQFGAYASFLSFFGLSQLPAATTNFTGIVDYASAMVFEVVTNATVTATSYPSASDISVRFLFVNGSAAANPLTPFPLFGQSATVIPWTTFVTEMNQFAVGDQTTWCTVCGVTTGVCAGTATATATGSGPSASATLASDNSTSGSGGMSRVVAGVIGAMVTLAVILGLEALVMLVGGFRLAKKNKASGMMSENVVGGKA